MYYICVRDALPTSMYSFVRMYLAEGLHLNAVSSFQWCSVLPYDFRGNVCIRVNLSGTGMKTYLIVRVLISGVK